MEGLDQWRLMGVSMLGPNNEADLIINDPGFYRHLIHPGR